MIKFAIRLIIVLGGIVLSIGIASGIGINSFLIAGVFVSVWILIVPFKKIVTWILAFSTLFSILHYDNFGIYVVGLMSIAFMFNFLNNYLKRLANNNVVMMFAYATLLTVFVQWILEFIIYKQIFINFDKIMINIVIAGVIFYIFRFVIIKSERVIDLYTHDDEIRSHT